MKTYKLEVSDDGTKHWYLNGKLHREDGPAVEYASGTKHWCLNGKLHREDGPAVECADGSKYWYIDGKLHREDGPAVECVDGSKAWYLNDKRHREDGPAIECADGTKYWYLNDNEISEAEFNARLIQRLVARAEAECLEQARLLGMSGEREADLLGKIDRLHRIIERASAQFFHEGTDGETIAKMFNVLNEAK